MDPGDEARLAQAVRENRVFLTKDHDIGTLVYRDLHPHRGVLLVDDLGAPAAESALIPAALSSHHELLAAGAFLRGWFGGRSPIPGLRQSAETVRTVVGRQRKRGQRLAFADLFQNGVPCGTGTHSAEKPNN